MVGSFRKVSYRPSMMLGACLLVLAGVLIYEHRRAVAIEDENKNYSLVYSLPKGWRAMPHSPQAIFLFRNRANHLLLRASMSDVVADYNPDPNLDRDSTAQWMLDITHANLAGWNGTLGDVIDAKGTSFRIVRRWNPQKCVVSAIAVRGNTTIIVTLSADEPELRYIDPEMPEFRQYLTTLEFRRHIWTD